VLRHLILALLALAMLIAPASAATSKEIKEVAQDLVCLCGDCNRESLATCQCASFAVPQRENIGHLLDEGKSRREITDEYVSTYGQLVLAAPPQEGFSLLVWLAPFATLAFGVFFVRSVLLNWAGAKNSAPAAKPVEKSTTTTTKNEQRERLRRELDRFDFDEGE